jgi:hypothetical protein
MDVSEGENELGRPLDGQMLSEAEILGLSEEQYLEMIKEHIAAEGQIERERCRRMLPLQDEDETAVFEANSAEEEDWDVVSTGTADTMADELREWEHVEMA